MPVELKPLPPKEAIDFFRSKGFRVSFAWTEVWQQEHALAFTVAKAARLDILADIRDAVDAAIADGQTLRQFEQRLGPILQEKGWWGRREVTDPNTGERRDVQLGSRRRLRIIYDTNLRSAFAAGRWQRIEQLKARRPFLRYTAVLDSRTRPQHAAWHDTVLPVDHPFWSTHHPPNGWHCRCTVQQLSQRDLDRRGLAVTAPPAVKKRRHVNSRTGRTSMVPDGIDPGFAFNIGQAARRSAGEALNRKLETTPADIARVGIADGLREPAFRRFLTGAVEGNWAIGQVDDRLAGAIGARARSVLLSQDTAIKQINRGRDLTASDYRRLQTILDRGEVIQETPRHLAYNWADRQGRWWRAVVKATRDGNGLFLLTYHRTSAAAVQRRQARGEMLRGLEAE